MSPEWKAGYEACRQRFYRDRRYFLQVLSSVQGYARLADDDTYIIPAHVMDEVRRSLFR